MLRANKMSTDKIHLRHCILYEFEKDNNASKAAENICEVFGTDALCTRTCQRWFEKFRVGDLSLKEQPRSGRPSETDDDLLRAMLEDDPHLTTREIGEKLGIHYTTVADKIKSIGFILKLNIWVPHELTEKNLLDRVSVCSALEIRNRIEPFLDRLITGDEKWILYESAQRHKAYCMPGTSAPVIAKQKLTNRKAMLCVWWDRSGIIYYELLKYGETVNTERYCNQLEKLNEAVKEKRPVLANRKGIVFLHDNARPHTAIKTQKKLNDFGWEVLSHPPYSPDIAPSDYYLFRSMQNFLHGKIFQSFQDISKGVSEYFDTKDSKFFANGINKLPIRWLKVVNNNGHYIVD